jgi:hypothetical protein
VRPDARQRVQEGRDSSHLTRRILGGGQFCPSGMGRRSYLQVMHPLRERLRLVLQLRLPLSGMAFSRYLAFCQVWTVSSSEKKDARLCFEDGGLLGTMFRRRHLARTRPAAAGCEPLPAHMALHRSISGSLQSPGINFLCCCMS